MAGPAPAEGLTKIEGGAAMGLCYRTCAKANQLIHVRSKASVLKLMKLLRPLIYVWVLPTTSLGLWATAVTLVSGGQARWHSGVLEVYGGFSAFFLRKVVPLPGGASAMTLGHVVIARDAACHTKTRAHERIHVRQCERWGPLFIPAYLLTSLALKLRGRDAYHENPFEREAFENS
jgi:hypothetical protein